MPDAAAALVRAVARVAPVPYVPEIRLYQADASADLWFLTGGEYRSETPPPFWAFAWAGGRALARYVLDHPDLVAGRSVLDLAAGSGIVGIATAMAGAGSVLAVDVDPAAVAAIALNAEENGVEVTATLGDPLGDSAAMPRTPAPDPTRPFDVVLAGDVFYSAAMAERVLGFLRRAARDGSRVLVGDADRGFLPQQQFRALRVVRVPVAPALEGRSEQPATIWELPSRRPSSTSSADHD